MLNVNDLININRIPDESEVSLKLLLDFYDQYLSQRFFVFTLKNGEIVKLNFRDPSEIFHISGIEHIYSGVPMDGSRFINEIRNNNLDLSVVKNVNSAAYKDYIDRIRSMFCIDTIIKNCEYLFFPSGKIPGSTIKITYLLLKGLDEKNIHLGIDSYKKGKPYFSRTLLVTEGNTLGKFVDKADLKLKVTKLEIRDKKTDALLEIVNREQAEIVVNQEITKIANIWLGQELTKMLWGFFTTSENVIEAITLQLIKSIIDRIRSISADISFLLDERTTMDDVEWKDLLISELKEALEKEAVVENLALIDMSAYRNIFQNYIIRRQEKESWKRLLHTAIDGQKGAIRQLATTLDPYWSGKITGESIRQYVGNDAQNHIESAIKAFVQSNSEALTLSIIRNVLKEKMDTICIEIVEKL